MPSAACENARTTLKQSSTNTRFLSIVFEEGEGVAEETHETVYWCLTSQTARRT